MLVAESARRTQLGSVRFQRWLPFKVVSLVAVLVFVTYYSTQVDILEMKAGSWEEDEAGLLTPLMPNAAQVELGRQALRLRPLIATMDEEDAVKEWNEATLARLETCATGVECGPSWDKLAILNSWHFVSSKKGGVSGEDIWANSTIEALEYSGYTLLYAVKPENVLTIYLHLGSQVRAVFWEGAELQSCINDDIPATTFASESLLSDGLPDLRAPSRCMRRPDSPGGVPVWKSFVLHFWGDPQSPLGSDWTLAPYEYGRWQPESENYYLGYSIENRCRSLTPNSSIAADRAILLGKHEEYFVKDDMPWKGLLGPVAEMVSDAQHINFTFAAAMKERTSDFQEEHVDQLGMLSQQEYMQAIASSFAMLGVGVPYLSPSPFESLCLGTPFINPIRSWDKEDPWDRSRWYTQHDALLTLDAPHVYHVHAGNVTELAQALDEARRNPIKSFIPEDMTFQATVQRHRRIMEEDWLWRAEEIALDMDEHDFGFLL